MSDKQSQNLKVLDYLRKWGSITPAEAWTGLHLMRLSARIYDLREAGNDIENTEPYGRPARYVLKGEARRAA